MAVDVKQGGLQWEAGIGTSELRKNAQEVQEILSGISKKQQEEEKKIIGQLNSEYQAVKKNAIESFSNLNPEIQKQARTLEFLVSALQKVGMAQNRLDEDLKKGVIGQSQYNRETAALTAKQDELSHKVRQYTQSIQANNAVMRASNGSIDQKRAKLTQLTQQWNALSASERGNAQIGGVLQKQIRGLDTEISKLDQSMRSTKGSGMVMNQVLMATAGIFSLTQGTRLVNDLIAVRGEMEQLEVAFTTMLQSKEKADQLMREVVDLAVITPYGLNEVAAATKQLLAYGFAQEEVRGELLAVGNIAAGVGAAFGDIAYAYGTLKAQGRAYAYDIRQFTTRGIPIIAELAKQFEKSEAEVMKLVEAGKVGFPEVQKAFQSMTGAGGMFFDLMEKQSKTVTGQIARLQDEIQLMFNEIGKGNEGLIKSGISGLAFVVENYEKVIAAIQTLVVAYGTYRTAVAITTAVQAAQVASGGAALTMNGLLTASLARLRAAQLAFNSTALANPYVAIATALGLLIGAIVMFSKEAVKAETAQVRLNRASEQSNALIVEQESKVKQLASTLQNQNIAESVRLDAYNQLKSISPDIVKGLGYEEAKTADLTKEVYNYITALQKRIKAENLTSEALKIAQERAEIEERLIKAQEDLNKERERGEQLTVRGGMSNIKIAETVYNSTKKELENIAAAEQAINSELEKSFDNSEESIRRQIKRFEDLMATQSKTSEQYRKYEEQVIKLRESLGASDEVVESKDKAFYEAIVKSNTEALEALDSSADTFIEESLKYKEKIKEAQKNLSLFDVRDKEAEKQEKKQGKDLISAKKDVLDELEKLEIRAYKKSFERGEQELADTKRKFDELRKAAKEAGMDTGVINRINNVEESATGDIKYRVETEKLKEELDKRKKLYDDYEKHLQDFGIESANKRYSGELDVARTYLDIIQSEYDKLVLIKPDERTGVEQERLNFLSEELDKEKRFREESHKELLKMLQTYEDQRDLLIEERARKRALLNEETEKAEIERLNKFYDEQIGALNEQAAQDLSGFTKFFDNIDTMSRRTAKQGVEELIKELIRLANLPLDEGGVTDKFFNEMLGKLTNIKDNINKEIPQALANWGGELNNIASAIGDANSGFATMLKTVGNIITQTAQIKTNIDAFRQAQEANNGEGDALGMVTAGLGVASGVIGGIMSVVNLIKSAGEKQIALQKEALALQKQIYYGELELSKVKRERALEDSKAGQTTLDGLRAQQKVIEESFKGVDEGIAKITQQFNKSFENLTVGEMLSVQFEDALKEMMYYTGETKTVKSGFLGLGRKEVQVMESLAGLDFSQIEELSISGKLTEEAEAVFQKLKQLKEEGKELDETLKEIEKELNNIFTGGLEWSGMADGIIAEFQGAGSQIEEILQNAILNGFKYRFLEEPLQKLIDQFAEDAQSGDELTQSEIDKFTQAYSQLSADAQKALKQLEESTGISLSGQQPIEQVQKGLSGAIRREMTEATASELSGLFRGFYDLTKVGNNTSFEHLKVGKQQADTLIAIQVNTFNTVGRLDMALVELRNISKNTKPGQSGRDLGIAP